MYFTHSYQRCLRLRSRSRLRVNQRWLPLVGGSVPGVPAGGHDGVGGGGALYQGIACQRWQPPYVCACREGQVGAGATDLFDHGLEAEEAILQ